MGKTISRDTPLAEITLRKYAKPLGLEKRELAKKLCLSLGLLQPGDSRDVVVDVLQVILEHHGQELSSQQIEQFTVENRKKYSLVLLGIAPSNIRRQIFRLRDLFLVEKIANNYRVSENSRLSEIFEEKLQKYYIDSIVSRVKEYIVETDNAFLDRKKDD